jgi:transposase
MATLDEIGEDKQQVLERLARLDAERARLADQLSELEIAERVLTEFGRRGLRTSRRTGNLAATAPTGEEPSARGGRKMGTVAVRDAVLKAVEGRPQGATASEILAYVSQEFGLKVRPNHLGMALHRHRRGGRLQLRDQRWYLPR